MLIVYQVLFGMDFLIGHLQESRQNAELMDNAILKTSIERCWEKLDKYYKKTDDTAVYAAAMMLDPRKKGQYIDQNWQHDWIGPTKQAVTGLWEHDYKSQMPILPGREAQIPTRSKYVCTY